MNNKIKCRGYIDGIGMFYSTECPGTAIFEFNAEGELQLMLWDDELHKLTPEGDVCYSGYAFWEQTLMFTIGLHDCNDNEIYDGDVLQFYAFGREVICSVEYDIDDEFPCYVLVDSDGSGSLWSFCYDDIKIIGNKYENSNLLDVK